MILLHLEPLSRQITKSDLLAFLDSVGGLERAGWDGSTCGRARP